MQHHVHKKTGPAVKEWELLWTLFTTQDPHQQELLCNELLQLPAARINRYLLEYVYLAVSRPSGPLERAITELCGRSFNTAVQVSWLLLALLEDQPGNRHIQQFRDACERAALTGGQPSQPHYLQTFTQQQLYQQPSPYSNSPSAATSATHRAPAEAESTSTVPPAASHSDASSAAASPFAFTATSAFNSSRPSSPCRSLSAVVALAASVGSLSGSHRFRDSLDLELMKHASQDLAGTAGRTPTEVQQQAQQQQHNTNAHTSAQKQAKRHQQTTSNASSPDKQLQEQKQRQEQWLEVRQQSDQVIVTGIPNGLASIHTSSSGHGSNRQNSNRGSRSPRARGWAVPGSAAASFSCFDEYFVARDAQLTAELGQGQGVSQLIAASHDVTAHNAPHGVSWLVTHEEELMSTSMLLEMPPRSPRHAAGRDSYLATLDFVEALCETSSSLTRFPPSERRKVLRRCLGRINQEVLDAAEQGVAVRYPVGGCHSRVLRLLANDAVILNSRDKAPFLLMLEVQEDADFVDEVLPGVSGSSSSKAVASTSPARSPRSLSPHAAQHTEIVSASAASGTNDVLPCSPDQQHEHTSRPLQSRQQQLLQQLNDHPQQRRPHNKHHGLAGAVGTSLLSRTSSPAPASPQTEQQHLQQQQQDVAEAAVPAVFPAGADADAFAAGEVGRQGAGHTSSAAEHSTNILSELAVSSATAMHLSQQQCGVASQQQQQQQQEQRQQRTAALWGGGSCSMAGSQAQQRSSSPAQLDAVAAAAAVAPATAPTMLELQMQEAAAVLRGEKVIRLHIGVVMHPETGAAGRNSGSGSATQRNAASENEDDDSSLGPWVFGELPACSSSEDISKQAAGGVGVGSNRRLFAIIGSCLQGQLGQLVRVQLEVVESAPVAQQLLLHHKTRRRLPSMEAIDIIAGKLGKADIPPPTEIGPPLQLTAELSTSSRSSSGSIDSDMFCTAPLSPAPLATVAEGDTAATDKLVAFDPVHVAATPSSSASGSDLGSRLSPPAAAAAAEVAATGAVLPVEKDSAQHAVVAHTRLGNTSLKAERRRQATADASGTHNAAEHAARSQEPASKRQQQQQQQQQRQQRQQQQAGAGWWGFLRKQQQGSPSAVQQQNGYLQGHQAELDAAAEAEELSKQADQVYGERWAARSARLRAASPFGSRPGWGLTGVIVKSGDDCRQELLALQLIRELGEIWAAAELPLWVLPFEVLVTSSGTALIQLIPDATSVHSIKAHTTKCSSAAATGTPKGAGVRASTGIKAPRTPRKAHSAAAGNVSLSDHFFAKWKRGSPECLAAQRRFVESLAGYSLVTYLLQVKDRHNGNIMMDSQGHLIHIDYGFMLSNAPGGNWVRFEAAPMKLTRELLEVMDSDSEGQTSDLFDYFKVLCIQGFLAARKQRHRLTGLVRIMADCSRPEALCPTGPFGIPPSSHKAASCSSSSSNSGIQAPSWPCFHAGAERVVAALESRFAPQLSESACVQHVLRLISGSLDAWSTRQYDYYQRVLNGIL